MGEWKEVKLGDISTIESGGTPSSSKKEYWENGNILWATLPDLKSKYIHNTQRKITELGLKKSSAKLLPKNTIIFSSRATIGEVSIAKKELCTNQGSKNLICNTSLVDTEFIYYLLIDNSYKIENIASGATYKEINKTTLSNFQISIPESLKEQQKIATILSNYDDLIENNNKRIELLEKTAKLIYDEWFVKFKFPGHSEVEMVDSELGKIPKGWEIKSFSEVVEINPKIKVNKNQIYPFVDMSQLSTNSMNINGFERKQKNSGSKFQNKDTLFARITPCLENGKTGYVNLLENNEVGVGSTEFYVFRNKIFSPEMIYLISRDEQFRNSAKKSMVGASGRQRVAKETFNSYLVSCPPKSIIKKFSLIIEDFFDNIHNLSQKNKNIQETRDLLLPKLINNMIDVSNLDIKVPEVEA